MTTTQATQPPAPRIALLVLACHAAAVLEQLAALFAADRFRIFVHLDARENIHAYSQGRHWPPNLEFIPERFPVFWGGFNMVRATEIMARTALRDPTCAVCALVSDDTLPVLNPDEVYHALRAEPDRIDVGLRRRNPPFQQRYDEFFFLDAPATSARYLSIEQRTVDVRTLAALRRLEALRVRGKYRHREVWGGSQWWSLGRASLEASLAELRHNTWLRESFEFSAVPDESVFHTLHANRLGLAAHSFTSPMLADMNRTPAPFVYTNAAEIPKIPPGKLFLRKIDQAAAVDLRLALQARWSHA